jgi:hypothetical protein
LNSILPPKSYASTNAQPAFHSAGTFRGHPLTFLHTMVRT